MLLIPERSLKSFILLLFAADAIEALVKFTTLVISSAVILALDSLSK
jgi:hypothetical protein